MPSPTLADVRGRVETDLADNALQAIVDDAVLEISDRYGPWRDVTQPITVTLPGRRRKLDLLRPIDATETIVIVEWITADVLDVEAAVDVDDTWVDVGQTPFTLNSTDYRLWYGGRTLERLFTGSIPRPHWGSRVDITYVPVDDTARRNEVVIKLVIGSLEYEGVIDRRVGDVQTTHALRSGGSSGPGALVFHAEREHLLSSLQPRRGLLLR